jgi:hypothetical protein
MSKRHAPKNFCKELLSTNRKLAVLDGIVCGEQSQRLRLFVRLCWWQNLTLQPFKNLPMLLSKGMPHGEAS